ncbi:MAG: hypothetical protein M3R54_03470 [Chloroflexota bacterium]|nr:hypothetical protein [Chloroflexota bacterium]
MLLVLFVVPAGLVLQASSTLACSCVAALPAQHLVRADVVFAGRLVGIDGPAPSLRLSSTDSVDYRFEVNSVLKGAAPVNARVRSAVSGASCGLEGMREGERYTVFARAQGELLQSGLCDGTYAGDPSADLALASGVLLPPTTGAPPGWVLMFGAVAAALAATMAWRDVSRALRR